MDRLDFFFPDTCTISSFTDDDGDAHEIYSGRCGYQPPKSGSMGLVENKWQSSPVVVVPDPSLAVAVNDTVTLVTRFGKRMVFNVEDSFPIKSEFLSCLQIILNGGDYE